MIINRVGIYMYRKQIWYIPYKIPSVGNIYAYLSYYSQCTPTLSDHYHNLFWQGSKVVSRPWIIYLTSGETTCETGHDGIWIPLVEFSEHYLIYILIMMHNLHLISICLPRGIICWPLDGIMNKLTPFMKLIIVEDRYILVQFRKGDKSSRKKYLRPIRF